jgi:transcriptional regulator with GAF, ATPase, and Fis domain
MHVIERAVLTAKGGRLRFELPGGTREPAPEREATTREVLTEAELQRSHDNNLRAALEQTGWKIYGPGGTAELLGMKPTTLTARIKKAGLRKPDR